MQQDLHPATRIHRQFQGIRLSFHPLKRDRSGQCSVFVAKRSGDHQPPERAGRLLSKEDRVCQRESPNQGIAQEFRYSVQGRGNRYD